MKGEKKKSMARGGLGKLKTPSIMIAVAIPKTPKIKVPKVKAMPKKSVKQ